MAKNKEQKETQPTKVEVNISDIQGPKLPEYKQDELLAIFDELIFNGEYKEEVTVRGKLKVEFRSRSSEETMDISRILDSADYKLISTLQEQRAFMNLCKSLVKYHGRDLSQVSDDERTKFVKKLPIQILAILADKLAEFDRKVDLACREAEANF